MFSAVLLLLIRLPAMYMASSYDFQHTQLLRSSFFRTSANNDVHKLFSYDIETGHALKIFIEGTFHPGASRSRHCHARGGNSSPPCISKLISKKGINMKVIYVSPYLFLENKRQTSSFSTAESAFFRQLLAPEWITMEVTPISYSWWLILWHFAIALANDSRLPALYQAALAPRLPANKNRSSQNIF